MQKNMRIRKALFNAGLKQGSLGKIIGRTEGEVSVILNAYELAKAEQDEIIRQIKATKTS